MHDVAVVGAGIAGCSAAIHLARAGCSVLLLEQHAEPRRKACGEGILPRGMRELAELGLDEAAANLGGPIERIRFEAGPRSVEARIADGLGMRRPLLERLLLAYARSAGVEVETGATVTGLSIEQRRATGVTTLAGPRPASAVIAADGLHSRLRRLSGLAGPKVGDRFGITVHARGLDECTGTVRVIFSAHHELYLTPVGDGLTNVAMLLRKGVFANMARDRTAVLGEVFQRHGLGRPEFVDEPLVAGPFSRGSRRAWRANVVLAGDAAGFFDGITGDGISFALASGRLAARAVGEHLHTNEYGPFRRYERERRALARNADLLGRLTLFLARDPRLTGFTMRNLSRHPETFQRLVRVSSGDAGFTSLRPRDVAALLAGF